MLVPVGRYQKVEWTLAKNVGPVQVEFLGVRAGLVSGTLFGIPISPPM